MDNNFMKLRKSTFGGFNKQDVIAYIEKVKNDAFEEKSRLIKQVSELSEKISELEAQVSSFDEEKDKLVKRIGELSVSGEGKNETVEEINEATSHLKNVADELCQSLRDFMQRISENCCSVIIEGEKSETEEEFDGERFIAELEAEIYAKLGVDDAEDDEPEKECLADDGAQPAKAEECDKVSSILSSVRAFSTGKQQSLADEKNDAEDTTVSDILGSLSFLK